MFSPAWPVFAANCRPGGGPAGEQCAGGGGGAVRRAPGSARARCGQTGHGAVV